MHTILVPIDLATPQLFYSASDDATNCSARRPRLWRFRNRNVPIRCKVLSTPDIRLTRLPIVDQSIWVSSFTHRELDEHARSAHFVVDHLYHSPCVESLSPREMNHDTRFISYIKHMDRSVVQHFQSKKSRTISIQKRCSTPMGSFAGTHTPTWYGFHSEWFVRQPLLYERQRFLRFIIRNLIPRKYHVPTRNHEPTIWPAPAMVA